MWPLIISALAGLGTASASRPRDPKEKKPVATAIAIGIGVGTGVILYKVLQKDIKKFTQKKKNDNLFKSELDPKIKGNYPPSQYLAWADKLEDAFDYFWGTDEDAIYSVMRKLKNNNDWLLLAQAFGMRQYDDLYDNEFWFGKDVNLLRWMQLELDTAEKNKVNAILKSKKITYRI